jgi:hypothetical protein
MDHQYFYTGIAVSDLFDEYLYGLIKSCPMGSFFVILWS